MILYSVGKYQLGFIWTLRGSVFPKALTFAIPAAFLGIFMRVIAEVFDANLEILADNAAYSSFSFVLGFLLVFRTSQAYTRFWEGNTLLHQMRGQWHDACSSLIAFSTELEGQPIKVSQEERAMFHHKLIRLFSLLHATALQEVTCMTDEAFETIDINGLDRDSLAVLRSLKIDGHSRVDIVFQWIQQLIVNSNAQGMFCVAPPILSRAFQELSQGMVSLHNATKITETPFPFPYAQLMAVLLLAHLVLTPVVVCMWTDHWLWSGVFTFVPCFSFWCLNMIAAEIEQPFGDDVNDISTKDLQLDMNRSLLLLVDVRASRVPQLVDCANLDVDDLLAVASMSSIANQHQESKHIAQAGKRMTLGLGISQMEIEGSDSPIAPKKFTVLGRNSKKGSVKTSAKPRRSTLAIVSSLSPKSSPKGYTLKTPEPDKVQEQKSDVQVDVEPITVQSNANSCGAQDSSKEVSRRELEQGSTEDPRHATQPCAPAVGSTNTGQTIATPCVATSAKSESDQSLVAEVFAAPNGKSQGRLPMTSAVPPQPVASPPLSPRHSSSTVRKAGDAVFLDIPREWFEFGTRASVYLELRVGTHYPKV